MLAKGPTVGIQPQMALFGVVLTVTCAFAAYSEKYRRNQDDIDERVQRRYPADMMEQRAKTQQMTATLRGQDNMRIDPAMNRLVWGGKANLDTTPTPTTQAEEATANDDVSEEEEETRKRRKKDRKKRKKKKKQETENDNNQQKQQPLDESQKLMVQGMAIGATAGAVIAVAATVLLSNRRQ